MRSNSIGGIYKNCLPLLNLSSQPPKKAYKAAKYTATSVLEESLEYLSDHPATKVIAPQVRKLADWGQDGGRHFDDHKTFDPEDSGSLTNILWHLDHYSAANRIQKEALERAKKVYDVDDAGKGKANAFLHAYLSYRLTKALGPTIARRFTDANEVKPPRAYNSLGNYMSFKNTEEDMRADLFNNGFGRRLFVEGLAKNDQEAIEMIMQAVENGDLRVTN